MKVLIVEDEPYAREATSLLVKHLGHQVDTAGDAFEALVMAAEREPDLLICDWNLGSDPDGIDVGRLVQQRYGTTVILITAHSLADLRQRALGFLDVAAFLQKPLSLVSLSLAIDCR